MKRRAVVLAVLCVIQPPAVWGRDANGRYDDARLEAVATWAQAPDSVGAEVFRRQCAPCHGTEGRGDGPAAAAFNPPPRDLTDRERMDQLTDDELIAVIGQGRASMPGFAAVLSSEELEAVARYVRQPSTGGGRQR